MMKEVWRDVVGYEGYYMVSNLGRVMGIKKFPNMPDNRIAKGSISMHGYHYVHLRKDTVSKNKKVHIMVAQAFIPNPHGKPHINHKDGNKLNNSVDNLEWCTPTENNRHALRTGLRKIDLDSLAKGQAISAEKCKRKVVQLSLDGENLREYDSIKEAAKSVGSKSTANIINVCKGKGKTSFGYKWMYKEDYDMKVKKKV